MIRPNAWRSSIGHAPFGNRKGSFDQHQRLALSACGVSEIAAHRHPVNVRGRTFMDKSTGSDLPKLAAPAQRALASVGINKLEDLVSFTEDEIMELHDMGPNAMQQICQALAANQLAFAEIPIPPRHHSVPENTK